MKQRYNIKIAGYEMNVVSDDTPEAIDEIVAELDRSVLAVCDSSHGIPRSEAILLCALDAMSEKRSLKARVHSLENELYGGGGEAERLRREIQLLKAYIERRGDPGPELPEEDLTVSDGAADDVYIEINKDKEAAGERAKAGKRGEIMAPSRKADPNQLSFDDMLRERLQSVVSDIPSTDGEVVSTAGNSTGSEPAGADNTPAHADKNE